MMKQEDFSDTTESKLMPGQMLKAAREAQDISIETVSKYLHLTIPTILSIEEDHYEKMPAPVYVRGYLRRYAQLVQLSPEDILNAYEKNVEIKSKILEEIPSYVKKKPISSSHVGVRFITYAVGVLLLILVGLWWKGHEKMQDNSILPNKSVNEIKTSPQEQLKLQPTETQPVHETVAPPETAISPEKPDTQMEKKSETPSNLKSETQTHHDPITESKFRVTPEASQNKTAERINENTGEPKEKNSKSRPARQPSNTLDLY